MWLINKSPGFVSAGMTRYSGSRPRNGSSPRTTRPADDTIATRRCDSAGPVTQGLVSKSGHSSSARRCACAGGKSVNRVTAPLLKLPRDGRRGLSKHDALQLLADGGLDV